MAKTSYVLSKRIARGGMAEIYLGKAVGKDAFQRIVAIKRILPHYSQDREFVEMFRDEANICKRLQHANVVQVYDFCEVKDSYALIMEHVGGADFRTVLQACENVNKRMTVPMVLHVIASSARGLHYAHTKTDEISNQPLGIVHRDVSPQNILLSYEGEVKITDFGIASADDKITETRPGVVKGKYSYMSPEQVSAKHLDGRSDIFSLSIVLWEALAMKRLFAGKTEVETIRKVQNCEIPSRLVELNSSVDAELDQIVLRGLAKDPKKRYQTGAELERELLRYLHSRYPDFLASNLGDFLKKILGEKWAENQKVIKETLTTTDFEPDIGGISAPPTSGSTGSATRSKEIVLPESTSQEITLADQRPQSGIRRVHTKSKLRKIDTKIHLRPVRRARPSKALYIFPVALVMLVAGLAFFYKDRFLAKGPTTISLRTRPSSALIFLDGKNIQALQNPKNIHAINRYTKTPINIKRAPDEKTHVILVKRPGFNPKRFEFVASPGEKIEKTIRLSKKSKSKLISVSVHSKDSLIVDFDRGLKKAETPFSVSNLSPDVSHYAVFSKVGSKKRQHCTFKANIIGRKSYSLEIKPGEKLRKRCKLTAN